MAFFLVFPPLYGYFPCFCGWISRIHAFKIVLRLICPIRVSCSSKNLVIASLSRRVIILHPISASRSPIVIVLHPISASSGADRFGYGGQIVPQLEFSFVSFDRPSRPDLNANAGPGVWGFPVMLLAQR